jgi:formylglycine-generating enzyme required for sulfatase activity
VISVRLALFAEMVKGKLWTPATLREVGGTEGVGVTFLEETFSAATASPQHRLHQKAAQGVLKALLPEAGTDLKGTMRSQAELLAASGYVGRPGDFEDLIRILDSEIRLITPAEPGGRDDADPSRVPAGGQYYQLTHDYLVPSLRNWLTRKQKETHRGRAELLLADRAVVWNARPENRQLPSLLQWEQIRWWTRKKDWTPPQRKMMRQANRFHALRGLVVVVLLALLGWGGYEGHGRLQAHALLGRLLDANTSDVPAIVQDMAPYRRWLDPLLHDAHLQAEASKDARKQLHARLALLPVDATQVEFLYARLLDAEAQEVGVIRDALAPHQAALVDRLWAKVERPGKGREHQRLRAAAALARDDPDGPRWEPVRELVANDLVRVPAVYLAAWLESFRPVRAKLLAPLTVVYRDATRGEMERSLATDILADYAADQPQVLAELLMDAGAKQFAVLYPRLKDQGDRGLPVLLDTVDRKPPPDSTEEARERLARRQANAAVVLLKMNQPAKVWPLLQHRPDPRVRSYLMHRLGPLGADAGVLVQRLAEEPDVTIQRALILSLGPEEFGQDPWTPEGKQRLVQQLQETYRTAADPGLHAAAEWLLRQWREEAWLRQTDDGWTRDGEGRAKRLEGIAGDLAREKEQAKPRWYVNGQGQTMVVLPGPVEFLVGSPPTEAGRQSRHESPHRVRINRTYAIASKAVTVREYLRYNKSHDYLKQYAPDEGCPIHSITWYEAAAYCNWSSNQEAISRDQWCYETNPQGQVTKLKANYLSLTGYRLPTEAEWERACRAGAVTSRHYGESEELLGKYGWYLGNARDRSWPGGGKKPNDLGLFDMHGNVWNWCQDSFTPYAPAKGGEALEDKEEVLSIDPESLRSLHGGSFGTVARYVRSASRGQSVPATRHFDHGFRVVRTLPLSRFSNP